MERKNDNVEVRCSSCFFPSWGAPTNRFFWPRLLLCWWVTKRSVGKIKWEPCPSGGLIRRSDLFWLSRGDHHSSGISYATRRLTQKTNSSAVRNGWIKHHKSTVRIQTTIQNLVRGLEFHLLVKIVFLSPFFVPAELREDLSAMFSPLIQRGNSRRPRVILNYHSFYGIVV